MGNHVCGDADEFGCGLIGARRLAWRFTRGGVLPFALARRLRAFDQPRSRRRYFPPPEGCCLGGSSQRSCSSPGRGRRGRKRPVFGCLAFRSHRGATSRGAPATEWKGGLDSIVFFSRVVDAVLGCFDAVFARVVEAFRWLVFFFEVFFPLFFFEALVVPVFFFTVRRALVRPATTLFELFFFCGMWRFFRVRRPSVRVRTVFLSMFLGSSPTNLIAWRGVSGSGNIKCRHTPIW